MTAPRCLICGGSGMAAELRLVWKRSRLEGEPVKCSRRVESEEDGRRRIAELGEGDFDAQVVSCAKRCACRLEASPSKIGPHEWKMDQAGDQDR